MHHGDNQEPISKKELIIRFSMVLVSTLVIFGLCVLFGWLFENRSGNIAAFLTFISLALIIPIIILNKNIYDFFDKGKRQERANVKKQIQDEINKIRELYNVPENVKTTHEVKLFTKRNKTVGIIVGIIGILVLFAFMICETLFESETSDFVELLLFSIAAIIITYAFFVTFGKYLLGIGHSLMPIVCFITPLLIVFSDCFNLSNTPLFIIIGEVIGFVLYGLFLFFSISYPRNKQKVLQQQYLDDFCKMNPSSSEVLKTFSIFHPDRKMNKFLLEDGKELVVSIIAKTSVIIMGNVIYKNKVVKEVPILAEYYEGDNKNLISYYLEKIKTIKGIN